VGEKSTPKAKTAGDDPGQPKVLGFYTTPAVSANRIISEGTSAFPRGKSVIPPSVL
jgi:hypothetical protein